jgi:hypothetical protein
LELAACSILFKISNVQINKCCQLANNWLVVLQPVLAVLLMVRHIQSKVLKLCSCFVWAWLVQYRKPKDFGRTKLLQPPCSAVCLHFYNNGITLFGPGRRAGIQTSQNIS